MSANINHENLETPVKNEETHPTPVPITISSSSSSSSSSSFCSDDSDDDEDYSDIVSKKQRMNAVLPVGFLAPIPPEERLALENPISTVTTPSVHGKIAANVGMVERENVASSSIVSEFPVLKERETFVAGFWKCKQLREAGDYEDDMDHSRSNLKKSLLPEKVVPAAANNSCLKSEPNKHASRNVASSPRSTNIKDNDFPASDARADTEGAKPEANARNSINDSFVHGKSEPEITSNQTSGNLHKTEEDSRDEFRVYPSLTEMILRLKDENNSLHTSIGIVLQNLRKERCRNKLLLKEVKDMKLHLGKMEKEEVAVFSSLSEQGSHTISREENLRKKLKDASDTIQELLLQIKQPENGPVS